MNREQVVAKLSDEELQVRADELMGRRIPESFCNGDIEDYGEGGWRCSFCSAHGYDWSNTKHKRQPPDYLNEIAAARELWRRLNNEGYDVDVVSDRPTEGHYVASCEVWTALHNTKIAGGFVENGEHAVERAITRAFVMAMEKSDD